MLRVFILFAVLISSNAFCKNLTKLDVMFYNVENLFDIKHDKGKNDWTFLPNNTKGKKEECAKVRSRYYQKQCYSTDWNQEKLNIKLSNIKDVVTNKGKQFPDILGVCEIENENVVRQLADKIGYKHIVVANGPDKRGIDVALLYKDHESIKYLNHKEHLLKHKHFKKKPTRTILEVNFKVNNKYPLTVLVNHWPSQSNPASARVEAAKKALSIASKKRLNKFASVIIMGDFNTIPEDYPHPFNEVFFKGDYLKDIHEEYMKSRQISKEEKYALPIGSYFYYKKMTWNRLDRIFVSKNLLKKKGMNVILKSYKIFTPDFIKREFEYDRPGYNYGTKIKGVPQSYNFEASKASEAGYSDHFPVMVSIGAR